MNLGNNILKLRKDAKLSQEMLAEKIGVSRQTISNWELGETSPNPEQLKMLSKILKVSIDELLDNDVKEVLVEKVSNTEKLAGMIIKMLKIIGIIFIVLFIIDIIVLILFNVVKIDSDVYNEKTSVSLVCTLNDIEYNYNILYNDYEILDYYGSEYISNIINDIEFESGSEMVDYIESYFIDNGGAC